MWTVRQLADVAAVPVAWYFINKWLQDFAYHIDLEWWILVVASMLAFIIVLVTVSVTGNQGGCTESSEQLRTGESLSQKVLHCQQAKG